MTRKTRFATASIATLAAMAVLTFATPARAGDLVIHPGDAAFGTGEMRMEPNATFVPSAWAKPALPETTDKNTDVRAQYSAIASYTLGNGGAEMRVLPWADGSGSVRPGAQVAVTW